ncbi:hypothetical protein [Thiothrix caldifontis]|uniref:hypothetical protein n=1 Tax=Thiothrix caldifontis TaxID=525918 RepID=UPI0015878C22|nr:hypothetical protein [Thiothrix caldifontis]
MKECWSVQPGNNNVPLLYPYHFNTRMPKKQFNERTAITLLALLNLPADERWQHASDPSHLIHFNGVRFLGPYG